MSTIANAYKSVVGRETDMGRLVKALADGSQGAYEAATVDYTGDATDGDIIGIGSLTFEVDQINTDTTIDVTGNGASPNQIDDTDVNIEVGASHGIVKGQVLRIESEYLLVTGAFGTTVSVERGFAGSTAADHADGVDIYASAAGVTGENLEIPVGATLTNTTVRPLVAAGLNYWFDKFGDNHTAVDSGGNGIVTVIRAYGTGTGEPDNSTSTSASPIVLSVTNFSGGADMASVSKAEFTHDVTAAEASAGTVTFYVSGSPKGADVSLIDDSAGAVVHVGTDSPDLSAAVSGQAVTVTEGSTSWEGGAGKDKLLVTVYY